MGWTGTYNIPQDRAAYMRDQLEQGGNFKVVAQNMHGGTYYAAVEKIGVSPREVFAFIARTEVKGKGYNRMFMVKEMDETVGPYYWDASQAVMNALTPTTYEHAIEWRKKVAERRATKKRKAAAGVGKWPEGTVLRSEEPVSFTDKTIADRFTVEYHRKRVGRYRQTKNPVIMFRRDDGLLCTLRRAIQERLIEVKPEPKVEVQPDRGLQGYSMPAMF